MISGFPFLAKDEGLYISFISSILFISFFSPGFHLFFELLLLLSLRSTPNPIWLGPKSFVISFHFPFGLTEALLFPFLLGKTKFFRVFLEECAITRQKLFHQLLGLYTRSYTTPPITVILQQPGGKLVQHLRFLGVLFFFFSHCCCLETSFWEELPQCSFANLPNPPSRRRRALTMSPFSSFLARVLKWGDTCTKFKSRKCEIPDNKCGTSYWN